VIELPDDFHDLLIELADAGAEFVVLGGHAIAFHGHPRATKDLDVLVRATPANASRVYRALAAFGAPLDQFEVDESDFASYEGVLQIGVPPRRIDILNRADGISFDEAIGTGDGFDLEGRRIPVIGLQALVRNKRAAGREQDIADIKALAQVARSEGE
jgi:predicted nucleotidyltransferase